MYSKLAAVSVLAFFAQSALADCARSYTVKSGDWCDTISASRNVSTYQLAVVNPDINKECTNLQPDKSICLGNKGEDCSTTYVIKANDRCAQIISNHSLNSTIFDLNNPQINEACDNIYIGEVLCVSSSVQVPPRPAGELPAATIPPGATPAVPTTASTTAAVPAVPTTASTSAPALVKPTTTPAAAPAATSAAAEDDEDCEDDEDTTAAPAATSAAAEDDEDCEDDENTSAAPAATSAAAEDDEDCEDDEDDDDEDLPFCDEI